MNRRVLLIASILAGSGITFTAKAAPPEGKGHGSKHSKNNGRSNNGHKNKNHSNHSNSHDKDIYTDLVYAGITAALARKYALDLGLGGYSSLPPGIRKNLARGKPLPPGIAKKTIPGAFLDRLPNHPGYRWQMAGTDLILVSVATAVVADILFDVF